jgi:outer membrane lipoprotein carrier protein
VKARVVKTLKLACCAAVAAHALVGTAHAADDAIARVSAYLARQDAVRLLRAGRARPGGRITERATGALSIARPDRFRWDYREPYEQVIVADGRRLWLYDSDLQQVTVRSLAEGLGSTPAMLLSGAGRLADSFGSLGVERDGDWTWCRLKPLAANSDFESVSLGLEARTSSPRWSSSTSSARRPASTSRGWRATFRSMTACFTSSRLPGRT